MLAPKRPDVSRRPAGKSGIQQPVTVALRQVNRSYNRTIRADKSENPLHMAKSWISAGLMSAPAILLLLLAAATRLHVASAQANGCPAQHCVIGNQHVRFGDGNSASVGSSGLLQQPSVYSPFYHTWLKASAGKFTRRDVLLLCWHGLHHKVWCNKRTPKHLVIHDRLVFFLPRRPVFVELQARTD